MKSRLRNRVGILVASLLLWMACDTESNVDPVYKDYFIKYYGEDGHQVGKDLIVNSDGTMIILGNTTLSSTSTRILLIKIDDEGNIIWERRLGGPDEDAQDIEPIVAGLYAGGYLITTNTDSLSTTNPVFKVLRVDSDGIKIDSVVFDQYESQFANSITPLTDGGFIVMGNTTDTLALLNESIPVDDQEDLLSIRFNENGSLNTQWQKTFGAASRVKGIKIIEGSSTEYFFAAYADKKAFTDDPQNDFNFWLTTLDEDGTASGDELYAPSQTAADAETEDQVLAGIARSPFGIFMAVGTKTNSTGTTKELYTATLNTNFTLITSDDASISDNGKDIEGVAVSPYGPGGFLVLGNQISAGGSRDIWFKKVSVSFAGQITDEFGTGITFGGANNDDTGSAVAGLPNGDIVIVGTMNLVNQNKIALIKLKANGEF